jgi:hypothetical protein
VDLRAGLDDLENRKFLTPPGLELRPLGRPARSYSLYRLRYPDSYELCSKFFCFPVMFLNLSVPRLNDHGTHQVLYVFLPGHLSQYIGYITGCTT